MTDIPDFPDRLATVPILQTIERPESADTRKEFVIDPAGRVLAKLRECSGSVCVDHPLGLCLDAGK